MDKSQSAHAHNLGNQKGDGTKEEAGRAIEHGRQGNVKQGMQVQHEETEGGAGWKKSTQTLSEDVTMKFNTVCKLVKKTSKEKERGGDKGIKKGQGHSQPHRKWEAGLGYKSPYLKYNK